MAVGIRELKGNLSAYVKRATAGEEIVVTDHGRPVARLVPYAATDEVEAGIRDGWITAPSHPSETSLPAIERASSRRSTAEVLDEDRG